MLKDAAASVRVSLAMSIAVFDDALQHPVEPGTPSAAARLETVRAATEAGFRVTVFLMPIIPHLTDSIAAIDDALTRIKAAGATRVVYGALHLRPGAKQWFMQWLAEQHPELVSSYLGLYPGAAATAPKAYRAWLAKRVRPLLRVHGLDGRAEDDHPRGTPVPGLAARADGARRGSSRRRAAERPAARRPRRCSERRPDQPASARRSTSGDHLSGCRFPRSRATRRLLRGCGDEVHHGVEERIRPEDATVAEAARGEAPGTGLAPEMRAASPNGTMRSPSSCTTSSCVPSGSGWCTGDSRRERVDVTGEVAARESCAQLARRPIVEAQHALELRQQQVCIGRAPRP